MSLWARKYINESEGGAPEKSASGQKLLHSRSSILLSVNHVYGEPSGVHPSGRMFAGIGGTTPHGVRSTSAVIQDIRPYQGLYPIKLMPRLKKPEPWDE